MTKVPPGFVVSIYLHGGRGRDFVLFLFLLEFNLPTYTITPSVHPAKCPTHCLSPSHPKPSSTSLSTTLWSLPRVRCLSCFVTLTDIFTHFLSFPFIPFHYFLYSPNEWDHICLSFSDWLTSLSIIPSNSIHVEANGGYLSFLMVE